MTNADFWKQIDSIVSCGFHFEHAYSNHLWLVNTALLLLAS